MNKKTSIVLNTLKPKVKHSESIKYTTAKKPKSKKTIDKYKSLLRLYVVGKEKISDYNRTFINLFDKQTTKRQPISKETVRSIICAIIWFIETKNPEREDLLKAYGLFITHLRKSCLFDTRNNVNIKQVQMLWKDILAIREELGVKAGEIAKKYPRIVIEGERRNSDCKLNLKEKSILKKYLVSCIYTYNPPRRLLDYGCMNIIGSIKDFEKLKREKPNEVKKHNYYAYDNKVFIFCYYKTVKIYGEQYVRVDDNLNKIIVDYIDLMGLKDGMLLFGNKDFEQLVRNTFNAGINTIRHSFISNLYNQTRGRIDANTIDKISKQMAHSVKTNIGYYKTTSFKPQMDSLTFTFHQEVNVFDNKKNIKKRMVNMVLMSIIMIVVGICIERWKKYGKGKKKVEYIEETPLVYDSFDAFMK